MPRRTINGHKRAETVPLTVQVVPERHGNGGPVVRNRPARVKILCQVTPLSHSSRVVLLCHKSKTIAEKRRTVLKYSRQPQKVVAVADPAKCDNLRQDFASQKLPNGLLNFDVLC